MEYICVDGRILLKLTFKKKDGRVRTVYLALDRDKWHTDVNAMTKLWVL